MAKRQYYSVRTGKNQNSAQIDLATLLKLFQSLYKSKEKGQQEFRTEINELLGDYKNGFELSKQG